MKNFIISTVLFLAAASSHASALDSAFFQCVQDRLAAQDSGLYYGISKDDVIDLLDDNSTKFGADAVTSAKSCL